MGVAGVAWATFLCQGISCILAILVVLKRLTTIEVEEHVPVFSWSLLGKITVIAVPSILQQSFISIGNIILQGVINGFGPSVIAGYSASVKLNNLVITSFTTLGNGISNYTAQNLGSGLMKQFMVSTFTDLILRVAVAIGLAQVLGSVGIWMAWPIGWVLGTGLSVLFYRKGPWYQNNGESN